MSLALAVTAFAACTEKETFSTASGDDYPRIIDPVFPDWTDGVKPVVANISRDADFSMTLTVTPADYCTVRWYLDGAGIETEPDGLYTIEREGRLEAEILYEDGTSERIIKEIRIR